MSANPDLEVYQFDMQEGDGVLERSCSWLVVESEDFMIELVVEYEV